MGGCGFLHRVLPGHLLAATADDDLAGSAPRWQLLLRVLRRSWRRSRSQELLWGTNTESFWQQLKVWEREESLVWWIWTQYHRKRAQMLALMADPECAHFRVIRLTSSRELARYLEALGVSAAEPAEG